MQCARAISKKETLDSAPVSLNDPNFYRLYRGYP